MALRTPGLGIYLTAGYPDENTFRRVLKALTPLCEFIEIGVPTNNPKYDGPKIRRTHFGAKVKGVEALRLIENSNRPLIVMAYLEDHIGMLDVLFKAAADINAASVLLPDLLFEYPDEIERYVEYCRRYGLKPTFFISSNTPHALMRRLISYNPLFIYVGLYAATGIKLPLMIERNVREVRRVLGPEAILVAGFAINSPEMVRLVLEAGANAVVVGSALVDRLNDIEECVKFVEYLRRGLQ